MDSVIEKRRLALINQLFKCGIQQSMYPEPMNYMCILTLHDSVEMFLQLACEKYSVNTSGCNFLEYWDRFGQKMGDQLLTQKETMRKLNEVRKSLKHSGVIPSKFEIEGIRANVISFFEEHSVRLFSCSFDNLSLLDFVSYRSVREQLQAATNYVNEGKNGDALSCIALGYEYLVDEYMKSKRTRWGVSLFNTGSDFTFMSSFHMGITDRTMKEFVDKVKESMESMSQSILVIGFGFDYRKYTKFKTLVPHTFWNVMGKCVVNRTESSPSRADVEFCHDFVIECAMKLQDFDFSVSR